MLANIDKFIYEITYSKIFQNRFETLGSEFYISNEEVKFPYYSKLIKKENFQFWIKISLVSAPKSFIDENIQDEKKVSKKKK